LKFIIWHDGTHFLAPLFGIPQLFTADFYNIRTLHRSREINFTFIFYKSNLNCIYPYVVLFYFVMC